MSGTVVPLSPTDDSRVEGGGGRWAEQEGGRAYEVLPGESGQGVHRRHLNRKCVRIYCYYVRILNEYEYSKQIKFRI